MTVIALSSRLFGQQTIYFKDVSHLVVNVVGLLDAVGIIDHADQFMLITSCHALTEFPRGENYGITLRMCTREYCDLCAAAKISVLFVSWCFPETIESNIVAVHESDAVRPRLKFSTRELEFVIGVTELSADHGRKENFEVGIGCRDDNHTRLHMTEDMFD